MSRLNNSVNYLLNHCQKHFLILLSLFLLTPHFRNELLVKFLYPLNHNQLLLVSLFAVSFIYFF